MVAKVVFLVARQTRLTRMRRMFRYENRCDTPKNQNIIVSSRRQSFNFHVTDDNIRNILSKIIRSHRIKFIQFTYVVHRTCVCVVVRWKPHIHLRLSFILSTTRNRPIKRIHTAWGLFVNHTARHTSSIRLNAKFYLKKKNKLDPPIC